jgi:hypothetical protein
MHGDVFIYGNIQLLDCCIESSGQVESTKIECNMLLKTIVIYSRPDFVKVYVQRIVKRLNGGT